MAVQWLARSRNTANISLLQYVGVGVNSTLSLHIGWGPMSQANLCVIVQDNFTWHRKNRLDIFTHSTSVSSPSSVVWIRRIFFWSIHFIHRGDWGPTSHGSNEPYHYSTYFKQLWHLLITIMSCSQSPLCIWTFSQWRCVPHRPPLITSALLWVWWLKFVEPSPLPAPDWRQLSTECWQGVWFSGSQHRPWSPLCSLVFALTQIPIEAF